MGAVIAYTMEWCLTSIMGHLDHAGRGDAKGLVLMVNAQCVPGYRLPKTGRHCSLHGAARICAALWTHAAKRS